MSPTTSSSVSVFAIGSKYTPPPSYLLVFMLNCMGIHDNLIVIGAYLHWLKTLGPAISWGMARMTAHPGKRLGRHEMAISPP